jgi:tripartite-type tricarboxylate transporter receptor subunit TctC
MIEALRKPRLWGAMAAAAMLLLSAAANAASFPKRPITLIVPYPAGGATDVAILGLAEAAKKPLGERVIIENKPGGGGAVGVSTLVGKDPNGYLLAVAVTSLHRAAYLNKLPFHTVDDVSPIIRIAGYLNGILVRPDSSFKTLKDLVEYAKKNSIDYMSSGFGTGGHIAMEELGFNAGGLKLNFIPGKGDPECSAALMGGHVDAISTTSGWIPLVEAGKLRLLATYGEKRTKRFPNVPTVAELGYRVVHDSPLGIVGPKGMPKEITGILHDGFKKALEDPAFLATMEKFEMPILHQNTEAFKKFWAEAYIEEGLNVKKYLKK